MTTKRAGKMKKTVGKSILMGSLGFLLGCELTPDAAVLGLHLEDPPQRDAELVGLDDRAHEGGELGYIHPLHHLLKSLWRLSPMRTSPRASANSSESGPSMCSFSLAIAASKPSPASTLTARRSSASGSSALSVSRRLRILNVTKISGSDEAHSGEDEPQKDSSST